MCVCVCVCVILDFLCSVLLIFGLLLFQFFLIWIVDYSDLLAFSIFFRQAVKSEKYFLEKMFSEYFYSVILAFWINSSRIFLVSAFLVFWDIKFDKCVYRNFNGSELSYSVNLAFGINYFQKNLPHPEMCCTFMYSWQRYFRGSKYNMSLMPSTRQKSSWVKKWWIGP